MSYNQRQLGYLSDIFKKAQIKFDSQLYNYLRESIKSLILKKLITPRDAQIIIKPEWQKSAIQNWMKEPQFSSRCPTCQIDITGPRKLMHFHLKYHDAKRTEIRENEDFLQQFRIHYPTFNEFS